jgi:hypothetical protein
MAKPEQFIEIPVLFIFCIRTQFDVLETFWKKKHTFQEGQSWRHFLISIIIKWLYYGKEEENSLLRTKGDP